LRIAAGLSTKNATGFGICRSIQQVGGSLSVTGDREVIAYTLEVTRDNLETALKFLENAVVGQVFKPWELADALPRVKVDLANITDQVRAVEMLHRAAFRTGLGNSIFCPKFQVGKISTETLQHFYADNCTANRATVSGINVDHQVLAGYAQSLALESGKGSSGECKYRGGTDSRVEKGGRTASVAVATNGGSWTSIQEGLAFQVLQYAAGVRPATKRGAVNGALTKIIQSAAPNSGVAALNAVYSDNGLFGFVASGPAKEIGQAVEAGVKALKSASLSDEDVARGKAGLKSDIAFAYDSEASLINVLAGQSAILGSAHSLKALLDAVDSVQASDVKSVSIFSFPALFSQTYDDLLFLGRSQTRIRQSDSCSCWKPRERPIRSRS
jgi:ubiquinol-cytochrome c reductase core subunit 2